MAATRLCRLALIVCGGLTVAVHAPRAEPAPTILFGNPGFLENKKPTTRPPDVQAAAVVWPRLDPGSVVCRTDSDLERLAANRTGGPGGGPADCQVVRNPIGVTVVQRAGPGLYACAPERPER